MNINLRICSCQREKLNLWEKFSENLKDLLNKEVKLSIFKKFPQDLEEIDLFYASFSLSLHLIEKNYSPIAKFKDKIDHYLAISKKPFLEIKKEEKIIIITVNRAIFYVLLFYLALKFDFNFSKIQVILKDSYEEIEAEILNDKGDLYILPELRAKTLFR